MQITALVAGALFMENLDSTHHRGGAPTDGAILRRQSGRFEHRRNRLHAHFGSRHSDRRLDGGSLRRTPRVQSGDRVSSSAHQGAKTLKFSSASCAIRRARAHYRRNTITGFGNRRVTRAA